MAYCSKSAQEQAARVRVCRDSLVSWKYIHPVNMGIPRFPFLHDFRDPVVIIGTSFSMQTAMIQMTRTLLADTVRFENMSGTEWVSIKVQIQVV